MRLHFQLTSNTQTVPFDYQHFLTGYFHRVLGDNDLHDNISLYSLGWLHGGLTMRDGKRIEGGLDFPRGAGWFISAHDETLLQKIADAAMRDGDVCCGMSIVEIRTQKTPDFGARFCFKAGSPVLARSKEIEGRVTHYTHKDEEADGVLTQTLRHKMDAAGLDAAYKEVSVKFDRSYRNAKVKLVTIKGIGNRASVCPVIVEGTPEAVQFAWNVGMGHLTGNGYGKSRAELIYKTEPPWFLNFSRNEILATDGFCEKDLLSIQKKYFDKVGTDLKLGNHRLRVEDNYQDANLVEQIDALAFAAVGSFQLIDSSFGESFQYFVPQEEDDDEDRFECLQNLVRELVEAKRAAKGRLDYEVNKSYQLKIQAQLRCMALDIVQFRVPYNANPPASDTECCGVYRLSIPADYSCEEGIRFNGEATAIL